MVVLASTRCIKRYGSPPKKNILIYDFKSPPVFLSISAVITNPILLLHHFLTSIVLILLTRKKFDVVLASVPTGEAAIAAFLISRMFRVHLVVDVRDLYPVPESEFPFLKVHPPTSLNKFSKKIFSIIYKFSDKIVCVDANIKQKLIEWGVAEEAVSIIPNGADASVYQPSNLQNRREIRLRNGLSEEKFIFVYAGALVEWYPLIDMLKGLKRFLKERSDFQLLIVTFTNYDAYLKQVEKLALGNVVKFMGPLSVNDTAKVLSACDVGIVVYGGEDYFKTMYGGKIFSYMASGLPVLALGPEGSVISDLLSAYKTGVFVGEPSEENFARGILFFLNNKKEAEVMGRNARETVEKFYDRRKLGLKLVSLIENVLSARREDV